MCARTCFHICHVTSLFASRFSSLASPDRWLAGTGVSHSLGMMLTVYFCCARAEASQVSAHRVYPLGTCGNWRPHWQMKNGFEFTLMKNVMDKILSGMRSVRAWESSRLSTKTWQKHSEKGRRKIPGKISSESTCSCTTVMLTLASRMWYRARSPPIGFVALLPHTQHAHGNCTITHTRTCVSFVVHLSLVLWRLAIRSERRCSAIWNPSNTLDYVIFVGVYRARDPHQKIGRRRLAHLSWWPEPGLQAGARERRGWCTCVHCRIVGWRRSWPGSQVFLLGIWCAKLLVSSLDGAIFLPRVLSFAGRDRAACAMYATGFNRRNIPDDRAFWECDGLRRRISP